MPEDLCACDQSEPVDLDAWRAEAGEAAEALVTTAAIADGPWTDEALAAWAAAARTGWPRDAARVGVLCERVAALETIHAQLRAAFQDPADDWPTPDRDKLRRIVAALGIEYEEPQ